VIAIAADTSAIFVIDFASIDFIEVAGIFVTGLVFVALKFEHGFIRD